MSLEESEQAAAAVAKTSNRVKLADIEANLDYYEYVIAKDAVPPTQNAEILKTWSARWRKHPPLRAVYRCRRN